MKKIPHKTELKGLEKITELLKVVFASGFIDEKPLSCILVAPVSSGKTVLVKQFIKNKNVLITTDSTAYGLLKEHEKRLQNQEIRHIIIPDLLNAMARKRVTQEQLILFINSSSEDGLFPSHSYGLSINSYIEPFGWVICLTSEGYKKKKRFLEDIGFVSRFLVVQYNYNKITIDTILKNIVEEINIEIPIIKLKSSKRKKIKGNEAVFRELIPFSRLLCKEGESEIIRMQKKLQVFLKSCAYLRGDDKVTFKDLDKLKELIDLIK